MSASWPAASGRCARRDRCGPCISVVGRRRSPAGSRPPGRVRARSWWNATPPSWPSSASSSGSPRHRPSGSVSATPGMSSPRSSRGWPTSSYTTSLRVVRRLPTSRARPFGAWYAGSSRPEVSSSPTLPTAGAWRSHGPQISTLAAVFGHVLVAGPPGVFASRRFGNLILIASDDPLDAARVRTSLSAEPLPVRVLDAAASTRFAGGAVPVTDATAVDSPPIPA